MKSLKLNFSLLALLIINIAFSLGTNAQVGGWNPDLVNNSNEALQKMIEKTPKLEAFYDVSFGYVVFPKVTKVGIGLGGAIGKGIVYNNHEAQGISKLKQASIGLQFGGQQYSEVIFFENKEAFERFINGKLKFDGQASAVAIKKGASVNIAYQDGVAVFTLTKGGLMYEASLGGQHFKYKANG